MALSSGFFNSHNGDRKYTAAQLSHIFDGLISDGIYRTVGECFAGSVTGTMSAAGYPLVRIGTGRAWLDGVWVQNDAPVFLEITQPAFETAFRVDVVALVVDSREYGNRDTSLQIIPGEPNELNIIWPIDDPDVHYHPILAIVREPGTGMTIQNDGDHVVSLVGNDAEEVAQYHTPFVAGLLESISIGEIWTQWNGGVKKAIEDVENAIAHVTQTTILPGAVGTNGLQNGAVTAAKLAPGQRTITYENVVIRKSMFTDRGSNYVYRYRGRIVLGSDVTVKMFPKVAFGEAMLELGIFASFCHSFDGGVYVYCTDISQITDGMLIDAIECGGGVTT